MSTLPFLIYKAQLLQDCIFYQRFFAFINIRQLEKIFERVFEDKRIDKSSLIDVLLAEGYPLHCGGMSDPFQPCEKNMK